MSGHPTHEEDFDLYALGVTEGEERREVEAHIAACPACAQRLAEAKGRVAMLALAAPPVAPAANAKQRLMSRVHADAQKATTPDVGAATLAERKFSRWWTAILVPAFAVLAMGTFVLWRQNEQLDRQLDQLRQTASQEQARLAESTRLADLLSSKDTVTVALTQQPGMPKGTALVMYNMGMHTLMYDGELDAAPAGKSYQLWIVPTQGNPISAGVFQAMPGQANHWLMDIPQGVVPKAFAVTIEPAGGMPQPTGPKVLVAAAS
jgi:anti-sigma-K factor RskA